MTEHIGRTLAAVRSHAARERAAGAARRLGRRARLAALFPDEPGARRHIELKQKAFHDAGLELVPFPLGGRVETGEVMSQIEVLNRDEGTDAVFLQFPLPGGVDAQRCADAIEPQKDVDVSGSVNLGRLLVGAPAYQPPTPAAVLLLLEHALGPLQGRSIVIAGATSLLEACVVVLGAMQGATLCILSPQDAALSDAAAGADAVVITGDVPRREAFRFARSGAVLLDAGYFLPPRPHGWLSERSANQLGTFLPQYGNVGPLTVSLLIDATLDAATRD